MMSNTQQLLARLKQQKEEITAICTLWETVFPEFPKPDDRQCIIWLNENSFDHTIEGLESSTIKMNMKVQDGQSWTRTDLLKYASQCIRKAHWRSLSEDQKGASLEQKKALKKLWADEKHTQRQARYRERKRDAGVTVSDASDASVTQSDDIQVRVQGSGSGSNSFSSSGSSIPEAKEKEKKEKAVNLEPENPKPTPEPKPKAKAAPDGTPYPNDFNSWPNVKRIEWLEVHRSISFEAKQGKTKTTMAHAPARKWQPARFEDEGMDNMAEL
jgi:hypothetical protein